LKSERDRISIEHIYPQTETAAWANAFTDYPERERTRFSGSLGNLLLLSAAVNSSLQNDSFEDKKHPKYDARGRRLRSGYSDGSHSEIEVSRQGSWGPDQIRDRGINLLEFMERRWEFQFRTDEERKSLLFLPVNLASQNKGDGVSI
jgi:hypothetical protein